MPATLGYRDAMIDCVSRPATDVTGLASELADVLRGDEKHPIFLESAVAAHPAGVNLIPMPFLVGNVVGTDLVAVLPPIPFLVFHSLFAVRLGVASSLLTRTLKVLQSVETEVVTVAESFTLSGLAALGFVAVPSPLARHAQIVDRDVPSVSCPRTSRTV